MASEQYVDFERERKLKERVSAYYRSLSFISPVFGISHLFLCICTGRFLLCQHHFSLGRDLYALTQGLLQLLDALILLLQRILVKKKYFSALVNMQQDTITSN